MASRFDSGAGELLRTEEAQDQPRRRFFFLLIPVRRDEPRALCRQRESMASRESEAVSRGSISSNIQ
jgi:hypothetical protein